MAGQHTHTFALEGVPDVARPVVVAAEEDTTGDGECDRCNTAKDVIVSEGVQLAVGTDVEETARRIIRAGSECVAIGEEAAISSIGDKLSKFLITHLTALISDSCPVKV